MAVVGAKALTIGGEPAADYLIFGGGEEDVAVFGISVKGILSKDVSWYGNGEADLIWVKDRSCRKR